jgi:RHS repeat-associated protein
MKKIIFLCFLLTAPVLVYSQCNGSGFPGIHYNYAVEILNLTVTSPFTDTKNNSSANCYGNYNSIQPSNDIWYRFTITTQSDVYISHCGSTIDTYMTLYASGFTGLQIENDNNTNFCSGTAAGIFTNLAPGNYILVSEGKGTASGNITTTVSLTPIVYTEPVPPVNDGPIAEDPLAVVGDVPYISKNYITTYTPREKYVKSESLGTKTPEQVMKSVQYYDGLGRIMQRVQVKASPGLRDVVQPVVYDAYGRESRKFLPYVATATQSNGSYKPSPVADARSFYTNPGGGDWNAPGISPNASPFSQMVYEPSPLERVLSQGAPGADWKISSGHEIGVGYGTNAAGEIIKFKTNANGSLAVPVYWETASLLLNSVTSEENIRTKSYSDKKYSDRIYVRRLENKDIMDAERMSSTYWMDTYYVYNEEGNLLYVLPPELIKQYVGYTGEAYNTLPARAPSQTLLDKYAYQYKYDDKGRVVGKHLPGKEWELVVYNQKNLPVLTQDGKLQSTNQFLFSKYDIYGRAIASGVAGINLQAFAGTTIWEKRDNLQTQLDQYNLSHKEYESSTTATSIIPGYTNNSYPYENLTLNSLTYYDDYQFLVPEGVVLPASNSLGTTITKTARGMETGTKVRVLDTDAWILTIRGYDSKGQMAWEKKSNPYLVSSVTTENLFNFTGELTRSKTTHTKSGNNDIVKIDKFTYDHQGRPVKHLQCLSGTCDAEQGELIAASTYNELGALISKKTGYRLESPIQDISYRYNERGWLTSVNDPQNLGSSLFAMKLGYNNIVGGGVSANPCFDGNISSSMWNTASDRVQRSYGYKYDGTNRLKYANYNDNDATTNQSFDEGIDGGIQYDFNGNILKMLRTGLYATNTYGLLDNLTYTYDGNKLLKVQDNVLSTVNEYEFKDRNTSGNDYAYDINGNMTSDLNKQIPVGGITYNHLNLPTGITFTGGNKIEYTYDANGVKLQKRVIRGTTTDYTDYDSGVVYTKAMVDGITSVPKFEFLSHPEGYVKKERSTYYYIYQYKDHLGNVRLSYQGTKSLSSSATFDTSFGSFAVKGGATAQLQDGALVVSATGAYAGVHRTITNSAVPGRRYSFSFTLDRATTDVVRVFISETNPTTGTWTEHLVGYLAPGQQTMTFDYIVKEQPGIMLQIDKTDTSGQLGVVTTFKLLDFKIYTTTIDLITEDNYYPFGLKHSGYNTVITSTNPAQKYKYNGKEYQDELGLGIYDYGARNYDPALGRWFNIDPLAETSRRWTPYNYAYNNPVYFIDPDGMEAEECETCNQLLGFAAAVIDNGTGGFLPVRQAASRLVTNAKAFNRGQDAGDVASILAGGAEFTGGMGAAEGGVVVTVGSGGILSEVGVPVAVAGGLVASHGLLMGATATSSLASQKGRMDESSSKSSGTNNHNSGENARQSNNKVEKSKTTETVGGKYTKTTEVRPSKQQPGQSRAEYVRYKNSDGKVIKTHKDSYDRANNFQHRKPLRGGPEGRPQ